MGTRLYVGNLSYDATDADLSELFSGAGAVVSAEVVRDRETGRSRGFAFVEMETAEGASKAISMFNGTSFQDRDLRVNEAREREARGESGRGYSGPRDHRGRSGSRDTRGGREGGRGRSGPRW